MRWEKEHFGRPLIQRERRAADTLVASIEHFQRKMGLTWRGMAAALQGRLLHATPKLASSPGSQPVTANECTRAAAAKSAIDGWDDSISLEHTCSVYRAYVFTSLLSTPTPIDALRSAIGVGVVCKLLLFRFLREG